MTARTLSTGDPWRFPDKDYSPTPWWAGLEDEDLRLADADGGVEVWVEQTAIELDDLDEMCGTGDWE